MREARGFSLVEAVVAAGLLATGLLALAHVMAAAAAAGVAARHVTHATVLAEQKIEELRATRDLAGSTDAIGERGIVVSGDSRSGTIYRRTWTVQPVPAAPNAFVLQVRVQAVVPASGGGSAARVTAIVRGAAP
ncbi:MAG: hypothetical protein ACRD26_12965 [Vicinamibacterales bacterium]